MKNVEDIYPVSPMQEFMLLHALRRTGHDTLFNQFVFSSVRPIDIDAFESAWQCVVSTHASLRTGFIWSGVEVPQQVVRQSVKVSCEVLDLSDLAPSKALQRFEDILKADRDQGFDFKRAPLLRFKLVQFSPNDWRVVWSSHHLILDRWCIDPLMDAFQSHYDEFCRGGEPPIHKAPSYREYIAWIHAQDQQEALNHWARYLSGYTDPADTKRLLELDKTRTSDAENSASMPLGPQLTEQARVFSASRGITLSSTLQAAFAMVVNQLLGQTDVVFGMTVAGRPASIAHVEEIIGSFINTLPVRVKFNHASTLGEWLRDLNAAQFANAEYDFLSPAQIRTCAQVNEGKALYDVLMVWLTQTELESKPLRDEYSLPLVAESENYTTAFPLTLSVLERSDELVVRADMADGASCALTSLLGAWVRSLTTLVAYEPNCTLDQLKDIVTTENNDASAESGQDKRVILKQPASVKAVSNVRGREDVKIDVVEDLLQSEWQSVLGSKKRFAPDDDFFQAGGDSLSAAALHARVEAATRKTVPLLSMFEKSTMREMATILVTERWPIRSGIAVPLRLASDATPLFCIASPEVNTIGYAMLTRALPSRRNVVVLQAPPDSDSLEQLHPNELDDYAARYIEAMRAIQSQGPYSMISMCSGAHIALKMVHQLEAQSERVSFMGVINTWSMYSISRRFYINRFINVAQYYVERIQQILRSKLPAGKGQAHVKDESKEDHAPQPSLLPADSAVGLANPWIRQVGFAKLKPEFPRTKVCVSVFRLSRQPFWRTGESELGWQRLTGHARAIQLRGDDHDSILREPQVKAMANALEQQLEDLEENKARSTAVAQSGEAA